MLLSPELRLFAAGELGGLQHETIDGNAQAGPGYALGNSTQPNRSWRTLFLEQERSGSRS
ncbi:MAG: hypothetical protein MUD04_06620 [Cyanobium sp. Prado107]|nr:hypothetical protein [Cyanobium sp. Prado107]